MGTAADINWSEFQRLKDSGHQTYVEHAKRCNEFYIGNQWKKEDKAKLDKQGRPALTMNLVMATINSAIGTWASQKPNVGFKPKRKADKVSAELWEKLWLHDSKANSFGNIEGQVLSDGLIEDRGYFDVRVDFSDNENGEVRITSKDPRTILIDPDAKEYDPKTWKQVIEISWQTPDVIAETYGKDKADELKAMAAVEGTYGNDSILFDSTRFGDEDAQASFDGYNATVIDDEDREIRKVRVLDRQYYKLSYVRTFVDLESGDTRPVPESWDEAKVQEFSQSYGLGVTKKLQRRIRWTVTADKVVLFDDWSPYEFFTIVPYFPYFRRGKPIGMVTNLLDPQEFLNKTLSQELHVVNTTANSGWVTEAGSLTNMTADELEMRGAETGLVLEVAPGKAPPQKIMPNPVPTGLDNLANKGAMYVKEISGIGHALPTPSAEVSGVAMENNQARASLQLQTPFDNLNYTRELVVRRWVSAVQRFYTEGRVMYITSDGDEGETEEVMINHIDAAGQVVNDITEGEYDIVVTTVPARDTFGDSQFAQLIQLREIGVQVPDYALVESSNVSKRNELTKLMKKMQGFGELTPEEQQAQQMQQQIQMQMVQLEMAEKQAKAQMQQTQAMLNQAKATQITEGDDLVVRLEELRHEQEKTIAELQNRLEVVRTTNDNKRAIAEINAATNISNTRLKALTQNQRGQSNDSTGRKPNR